MANSDPMGLAGAYGSASIPQTLDDLVKQRVLQQQMLLRMAEEQRQRQEMAQREQIAQQELALRGRSVATGEKSLQQQIEEFKAGAPMREANVGYIGALTGNVNEGAEDRRYVRGLRGKPTAALTPQERVAAGLGEVPPETEQEWKERNIRLQGSVLQSGAGGGGSPKVLWRVASIQDGVPGTRIRYTDGSEEFVEAKPTADLTNRQAFMERFAGTIKTMKDAWLAARPGKHEGLGALYEGAKATGGAITRTNTPAKTYRDMRAGAGFFLARVLGSNSQLSDAEREAAADMVLPDLFDSTEVAETKFLLVQRLMDTQGDQASYDAMIRQLLSGGIGSAAQSVGSEVGTDLGKNWGERRAPTPPTRPKPMASHPRK